MDFKANQTRKSKPEIQNIKFAKQGANNSKWKVNNFVIYCYLKRLNCLNIGAIQWKSIEVFINIEEEATRRLYS